jgi:hypothetical protein
MSSDIYGATRKEHDMTQQAEARVFTVEADLTPERQVRDQIESTAQGMAAGDGAHLREAMDSVVWDRRGILGRLRSRPRTLG